MPLLGTEALLSAEKSPLGRPESPSCGGCRASGLLLHGLCCLKSGGSWGQKPGLWHWTRISRNVARSVATSPLGLYCVLQQPCGFPVDSLLPP